MKVIGNDGLFVLHAMDAGRPCLMSPPDARCPLREGSVADSRRASENALRLDGSPARAAILALSSSPADTSSGNCMPGLLSDFMKIREEAYSLLR